MYNVIAQQRGIVKHFEKIDNFRDIGGLKNQDGRTIKTGILFRSEDPSKCSRTDLDELQQFNFKLICDLRGPNERKSKVVQLNDNYNVHSINVPIQQNDQDYTQFEFFKLMMRTARVIDFETMMKDFYHRIAFESMSQIRDVITLLSERENMPALIHCTGGKDRTGMMVALIQLLVGVRREDVLEDYLLSNILTGVRMKKAATFIRYMSLFQISNERLKPLLEVRRDYLEDALAEIFNQYETIEAYLTHACGISEVSLEKLRELLLE
ncbi:tyrosine-protein phosphatase [Paenibacillus antarcticus]|uniref:Tyrosine specific protein phosphatases domain-containing protein n=1 Tax=Paenibacillus antarcticus TaxID=253703 RepID=A0A168MMY6_9BACL|nr:tyrosine-protein phosphatase [Paenibacillus antarcticus]OAB44860.1 hypothetical protein PBAT_14860 [Paenibacillus antarcticus]